MDPALRRVWGSARIRPDQQGVRAAGIWPRNRDIVLTRTATSGRGAGFNDDPMTNVVDVSIVVAGQDRPGVLFLPLDRHGRGVGYKLETGGELFAHSSVSTRWRSSPPCSSSSVRRLYRIRQSAAAVLRRRSFGSPTPGRVDRTTAGVVPAADHDSSSREARKWPTNGCRNCGRSLIGSILVARRDGGLGRQCGGPEAVGGWRGIGTGQERGGGVLDDRDLFRGVGSSVLLIRQQDEVRYRLQAEESLEFLGGRIEASWGCSCWGPWRS